MNIIKTLVVSLVFFVNVFALAQAPHMGISSGNRLELHGHTNNWYQIESSTNLLSGWSNFENYFSPSNTIHVKEIVTTNIPRQFFRTKCLVSADNQSYATVYGENDNVMVYFRGDVLGYSIRATHPTYTVTDYTLWADPSGSGPHTFVDYSFTSVSSRIYDDGYGGNIIWAYRKDSFWRPYGMTVTVNSNNSTKVTNAHYLTLTRKHPTDDSWPQFLVLYCDGNMRLIPFPPSGHPVVSFGTSVIVGPTEVTYSTDGVEARPICEILSADYRTSTKTIFLTYRNGGTAVLDVNDITMDHALVKVKVNYPTDKPFCTVRSNYTYEEKCDTRTVVWKDINNIAYTNPVGFGLSGYYTNSVGTDWFFTRFTPSITRNSSPDIRITLSY